MAVKSYYFECQDSTQTQSIETSDLKRQQWLDNKFSTEAVSTYDKEINGLTMTVYLFECETCDWKDQ